jgi:peptide/nickel transport system ATP-binding protein
MTNLSSKTKKSTPVLKLENLSVAFKVRGGEVEAVQDVSFEIHRGEAVGIVGESGCGKSTVAWAVVNFLGNNGYVKRGSIHFQGQDLVNQSPEALRHLRGDQIAMVYQDPMKALNPSLRIGNQMMEVITVHQKISKEEAYDRCLKMLKRVYMPDPDDVMKRYPHQLSGGQQQRVVIAMSLLNNPALLIMDEPTTALDVTVEAAVLDLIDELRREFDTAILYISHNLGVVSRVCTRVAVMYAGKVVELSDVDNIFRSPKHPYTQGLNRAIPKLGEDKLSSRLYPIPGRVPAPNRRPQGCVFHPRCDYAQGLCRDKKPELRPVGNGTLARCHFSEMIDPAEWESQDDDLDIVDLETKESEEQPIITVNNLKTYYEVQGSTLKDMLGLNPKKYVKAVEDASFKVKSGKTLGIVGESGCGKSTLIKTIIGLEESTAGSMEFMGLDISKPLLERSGNILKELQMVFQNPDSTMNPAYTVGQQIARPMRKFGVVPKNKIREEVINLLSNMRMGANYYDRLPNQLSGGEKQRIGIARALATYPEMILCDEPVSALDVSVQAAILNLLLKIQRKYGTTMIFIAHDLSVVRYFSDEIIVMYLGQMMEKGPAEKIYAPPYHPYTEALLSAVPVINPQADQKRIRLAGNVPSAIDPPSGCRFHTRCPRRTLLQDGGKICEEQLPAWQDMGDGHGIFCHIPEETLRTFEPVITVKEG